MTQQLYDTGSIAAHFSRAAPTYEAHAALQYSYNAQALEWLSTNLPEHATILDAGSGTGVFAQLTKPVRPAWQVIGCDISPGMCEISKPHQKATVLCDMQQWPMAENTLDAALCAFALQWSNAPEKVIASIAGSLKKDAPLLLYSFCEHTLQELREAARFAGANHIVSQFYPIEYYSNWIRDAGFNILSTAEHEHVEYFKNPESLFSHLKLMGASNSLAHRSKNLGNRGELKKIAEAYHEHFTHKQGIAATWKVVSVIARKS